MFASVPLFRSLHESVPQWLANFEIGTLADQSSLNWAIVPFTDGSRGSDPVAAVFDFSIGVRPRPQPRGAPETSSRDGRKSADNRPTGAVGPAIVNFGRVRHPVARGRDNSSLVWGDITPYNLP